MKTKVIITGFILSCMTGSLLCKSFETQEKVQVKWFVQLSNDENDPFNIGLYAYVDAYNNSQDSIEVVIIPTYVGCTFDATDTLLEKIENEDPPDIITLKYSEIWPHLMDLTPYLSGYDLSDVDSVHFFKYTVNNHLLLLTAGITTRVIFYNKALFDSAGLAYPPGHYDSTYADGEPWDMNKLEEIAMLLTLDNNGRNASHPDFDPNHIEQYGFHWAYTNGMGLMKMFGPPQIVSADSIVAVPGYTREGYKWLHQGIWDKHFIPDAQALEAMDYDPFGSGKVAMVLNWPDNINDTSMNWDIGVIPSHEGEANIPWGTTTLGILNTCQHPEEALVVIFTIMNTIDFYGSCIPTFRNLQTAVMDGLYSENPEINWHILQEGYSRITEHTSDGDGILHNMAAWRLTNDMRSYIQEDSLADIDGVLDNYFIPQWEEIFKKPEITSFEKHPDNSIYCENVKVFPNPVAEYADISFQLENRNPVALKIYNMLGQETETLIEGIFEEGIHTIRWETNTLPNGFYLLYIQVGKYAEVKNMIIQK